MLVILCDGSSKGNPGPASIGVVAWNRANNPRIVYPNYRYSTEIGVHTNMEAEWSALLHAMSFAISCKDRKDVYIFCDSQTVVKQATKQWKIKHSNIQFLYEMFCELEKKLIPSNLYINWVPRQLVYLADKANSYSYYLFEGLYRFCYQ